MRQIQQALGADRDEIVYGDRLRLIAGKLCEKGSGTELQKRADAQLVNLILGNIPTSCPLYKRSQLCEVGGFDERLASRQEWNLHIRLSLAGYRFKHMPLEIYVQRFHDDPQRITNRKMNLYREFRNLRTALAPILSSGDAEAIDAAAAYTWGVGRQFACRGAYREARLFFKLARRTSSGNFERLFSQKYRWLIRVVDPTLLDRIYLYIKAAH